jgi:hypothetical protein
VRKDKNKHEQGLIAMQQEKNEIKKKIHKERDGGKKKKKT